jgi:acetoin utilization deacetylase AcuC-like enzyme
VTVPSGWGEVDYLAALESRLPPFLDSVTQKGDVRLAIYNAGSDIFIKDQLGGLKVSASGVLKRDQFVLQQLIGGEFRQWSFLAAGIVEKVINLSRRWWGMYWKPGAR